MQARHPFHAFLRAAFVLTVAVFLLAGCGVKTNPKVAVEVLEGPPPVRSWTPMEDALACLKQNYPKDSNLRIGVGDIIDGTGQMVTGDSFSKAVTQRPDMMMIIGLSKTGIRQVNRSSLAVSEWEIKQAMEKRLGDGRRIKLDGQVFDYRPILAGTLLGSSHYVTGAVTELNWNIRSDVSELGFAGFQFGGRAYWISIAVDLAITNTMTTEIVLARSYSKQLVGIERGAGVYRFFNIGNGHGEFGPYELFELNIGDKKNEPAQTALRWIFETAAYDIVGELTGLRDTCDKLLPPGTLAKGDPIMRTQEEELQKIISKPERPNEGVPQTTPKGVDSGSGL